MNKYQKKLRKLCSDGNIPHREVVDYLLANEDKFTAGDVLQSCKHIFTSVTTHLMKAGEEFDKVLKTA